MSEKANPKSRIFGRTPGKREGAASVTRCAFAPLLAALVTLALLAFGGAAPSEAQSTYAGVSGRVTDSTGGVIVDAQVQIKNVETGVATTVKTNGDGLYNIPNLNPGQYLISASRPGFKTVTVTQLELNVQDNVVRNFALQVGSVSETITINGSGININTTDGTVSTTVDRQFVSNLPLNGRSFQSLILLAPGVVQTPSTQFTPGEFSVNGQRQNANYFTVDGVSANTGVDTSGSGNNLQFSQQANGSIPGTTALGTTASLVSIDALEEFKIQTSTYSAEFGRQPGGQVQLVTRSGTNQFHGIAFEYLRNDAMDARNYFNPAPDKQAPLRQNQFGGVFGGPIVEDKTFFFFSYEGQRLRLPTFPCAICNPVPSLRLRQEAAPALQPFLNSFPLPTGPEFTTSCDPNQDPTCPSSGQKPAGVAPFTTAFSLPSAVDAYSIRMDHKVSSKLLLFGRYGDTPSNSLTRDSSNPSNLVGSVLRNRTLTLGATLSVTPRLNNEFRFNYSNNRGRHNYSMDGLGGAVPLTLSQVTSGYSGPGVKQGLVFIRLPNFNSFQDRLGNDAENYTRQLDIVDNVSWVKGAHQLKFGVDWRRLNSTYGPYAFDQQLIFRSEASLISSTPNFIQFSAFKGARPIYDNYSAYAQDTWKLSPRLTLDLGLRWEINPAPHDANGSRPFVLTGIKGTDVSNVSIAPPNAPFYKTFKTAFAPRVGLAYQLNQSSGRETVLRGGFGVYYDLGSGNASTLFGGYSPWVHSYTTLSNQPFPVAPALVQPPPFGPVPTQLPILGVPSYITFYALDPNLQLPYTLQWNVALQQSLGRQQTVTLSYVASAARRLTVSYILNGSFIGPPPNPNAPQITYVTNGPTADYDSLQVQYQRRLSRGLQALVNYTWSHAIDVVSNEVGGFSLLDRGNADFDVRHNFSVALTYDLPKLSRSGELAEPVARFVKAVANGWSVDSVFYARTGTPLDLTAGAIFPQDGTGSIGNVRPDVVPGQPFWIKDPTVPGGQKLNVAAFTFPPEDPGFVGCLCVFARQGTLGRNAIHVPGMYQANMAVRRQFKFGERLNLQFKAEAFNILNHPVFGGYGSALYLSGLGVPAGTLNNNLGGLNSLYQLGGNRSMQVSLRLSF